MPSAEKYQGGRITWRKDYGPDLWSIRIAPDKPISFEPGQYATIGVEEGSKVIERAYSVVSSPAESELEFFFELVPQGQLTPRLHVLQTGDRVLIRHRAKGAFTLEANVHRDHFFVTTVTGIAPVVSIVRTLRKEPVRDVRIVVLQAASRSHELGYQQELDTAAKESGGWLRYVPLVSRPWEDEGWKGETGRAEDVLRKHFDESGFDPKSTTAYLCGHPMMIENGKAILLRRGFEREDIHVEVYWMPKKEKAPAAPTSP
jgi:ferredoxin--NADP+ reductase